MADAEIERLQQQVQRGELMEVRNYLTRTQQAQDWQDRNFVLNLLAPSLQLDPLTAAVAESQTADLFLLLGVYHYHQVGQSRGTKTAELTSDEQFRGASFHIRSMMDCLQRSYSLEPADPVPHLFAMRGLLVFSDHENAVIREFREAVRIAPDCVPAYYSRINARSKKWGGSHEESLQIARTALQSTRPGTDLPACLFLAHFHVWQYARLFDKDKPEADRYLKDPAVIQELNWALDRWIGADYEARRSSLPYLHQAAVWYYLSGDNVRLKQILTLAGTAPYPDIWAQIGDPAKTHSTALLRISPGLQTAPTDLSKKTGFFGWLKK